MRTRQKSGKSYQQRTKKEDFDPVAYARKLEINRQSRARRKAADPVAYKAKMDETARLYWAQLSAEKRARKAAQKRQSRIRLRGPQVVTGSVLACAAPSHWRDLLAEITRLVGRCDEREDIVSEAVLLTLEGFTIPDAIAQASRTVNYQANRSKRAYELRADGGFEPVDTMTLGAYV